MAKPKCGAKTRAGGKCKKPGLENGRCKLHGGKSTGAPPESLKGNQNARKHGLYSKVLSADERELFQEIKPGDVDDELRLLRIRLLRALKAEQEVLENPLDEDLWFYLESIETKDGVLPINNDDDGSIVVPGEKKVVKKRPDFGTIIDKALARIAQFEGLRKGLVGPGQSLEGTGVLRVPVSATDESDWEAAAKEQQAELKKRVSE